MAIKRAMIPLANDFISFPNKLLNSYNNKNKFTLFNTKLNNVIGANLTI